MTDLTEETARWPVAPSAIKRQWEMAKTNEQAGRSLAAFLNSPLGKRS